MKKIRIMTYNLGWLQGEGSEGTNFVKRSPLHFKSGISVVSKLIHENNIDIACFQEIDFNSKKSHHIDQYDAIKDNTDMNGNKIICWDIPYLPFPYFNHWGKVVSGGAILTKMKSKKVDNVLFDAPENMFFLKRFFYLKRYIQIIKFKIKDKDYFIFNLHLEAFDFKTKKDQLFILNNLIEQYNPIAICGDFNTIPKGQNAKVDIDYSSDPCIEILPKMMNKYTDIFGSQLTFPTENPNCRLDYIWVRSDIKAEAIDLSYVFNPSDHLPIALELTIS